jgi:hypothetical protein
MVWHKNEGRLRAQSGSFQSPFYEFTRLHLSLNFCRLAFGFNYLLRLLVTHSRRAGSGLLRLWRTLCPRFGYLCETNIVTCNSKHHLLGIRVFHFVCNCARFLCAIAPVFGSLIRGTDVRASRQAATASCWRAASRLPILQQYHRFPKGAWYRGSRRWNFDYASRVSEA